MEILFVSNNYYPHVGGVETQMRVVAHELARTHRVEIATLLPGNDSYTDGTIQVHSINQSKLDRWRMRLLRLIPGRYRSVRSWLGYQFYRSIYLPKLRPLVRSKDVIHALNTGYLSWIAQEAANIEGIPFFSTPYLHPRQDSRVTWKQRADVAFCNRADTVFALIETDRQMLIRLGVAKEKVRLAGVMPLLPEVSDPDGFRARHGINEKPIVLFVGRIVKDKGPTTILDAAPQVWLVMPDVHFVFIGPADESAQKWFTDRYDERIHYLGRVDEKEKGDALAASDLFCMPSISEILPAVYLEAWSYSKAVIGGSAHGLRELIDDNGAGITVEQDPELLAARIIDLLRDEPLRRDMGARGHALVMRRFSKAALVNALEEAYKAASRRNTTDVSPARNGSYEQGTPCSG